MNIQIRKATADDAEELSIIGEKTFRETWTTVYDAENLSMYINSTYSTSIIREEFKDPLLTYFVAMDDNKMVGFARLSRKQELAEWIIDRCIEICRFYVIKDYHDKKIGKLLMEATIQLANEEEMESVVLGVWENNHRAVAFYKKWGFEKIGTHPFLLGNQLDTDWVMRKKLGRV